MTATTGLERDYQAAIVQLAKHAGWHVHAELRDPKGKVRTHVQGDVGFPDLVLVHQTRRIAVFIELKRKPNRATKTQQSWHLALRAAGLRAHIVYVPEDYQRLLRFIADREVDDFT